MTESPDRRELQRRLEQARRMAKEIGDPLTMERLAKLVADLEEQTWRSLSRKGFGPPPDG